MAAAGFPKPITEGNLPLGVRYKVKNSDGSVSTVRTISIGVDGGEVVIPTVLKGKIVSDEEAIAHFERTGANFGTFRSSDEAKSFSEWLHNKHAAELAPKPRPAAGFRLVDDGVSALKSVFPAAKVTSGYRGPDHPLSRKNPGSFHARTRAAVDIAPIPGMTFEQARRQLAQAGYAVHQDSRDEVNNPSSHATGPHWHFVLGKR